MPNSKEETIPDGYQAIIGYQIPVSLARRPGI